MSAEKSKEYESVTRKQSESSDWVHLRKLRLTASQQFRQVHQRRKDFEKLVENFKKSKLYQSAAMKYGLEKEQEAAGDYVKETGNNVYGCGFVINPSAPYLGCSPDRKVYDPKEEMPGLLEIKCPQVNSFIETVCLKEDPEGLFKLKTSHAYYCQIQSQTGITGFKWCDLMVWCENDFHIQRIRFDEPFFSVS